HHRVGRRLDVDQARFWPDGRRDRCRVVRIDEGEFETQPGEDLVEETVASAVDSLAGDDVIPAREKLRDSVEGRDAGGEGDAVKAVLERGDIALQRFAGGVLCAPVFVPEVSAQLRLNERGGLVDRRHDGAGGGVRTLTRMHGQGPEAPLHVLDCSVLQVATSGRKSEFDTRRARSESVAWSQRRRPIRRRRAPEGLRPADRQDNRGWLGPAKACLLCPGGALYIRPAEGLRLRRIRGPESRIY